MNETLIWEIRAYIYQHFAETTRPPLVEETASHFDQTHEQAASAYEELQRRHAILRTGHAYTSEFWKVARSMHSEV